MTLTTSQTFSHLIYDPPLPRMHVCNLHYQSSNGAVSDPNVTSLFLTLTEPTTAKANYRLEKSQETSPVTTTNKLQHHCGQWIPVHI
jgi:hypothetical protein